MASTYSPIATTTLGSNTASVSFNSFSGYTDIRLIMAVSTSDSGTVNDLKISVNGDTSSGLYSSTRIYGSGTTAASDRTSGQNTWNSNGVLSNNSSPVGNILCDFMNYSNTTTYKTMLMRDNVSGQYVISVVNLWRNTNAITSINIAPAGGGNLISGSTFTIYGIKAA